MLKVVTTSTTGAIGAPVINFYCLHKRKTLNIVSDQNDLRLEKNIYNISTNLFNLLPI